MMTAPPCNQKHESADDSKNEPLRHFFAYLVCMPGRLRFVTSETRIWLQPSNRILVRSSDTLCACTQAKGTQTIQRPSILFRGRRGAVLSLKSQTQVLARM